MAATGGQATGVGVKANAPSIFSQAPSWLELQESMGSNCGGKSTFYKRGHDPAYWYTPLAAQCKLNDIPAPTSPSGLTSIPSSLPAYTFITPNLCHNNHWLKGCPQPNTGSANLRAMDTWLQGTVQTITSTASYQAGRTLILISFDESNTTSTVIPMVAVAGGILPIADGTSTPVHAPCASEECHPDFLGKAATANDMRAGMHRALAQMPDWLDTTISCRRFEDGRWSTHGNNGGRSGRGDPGHVGRRSVHESPDERDIRRDGQRLAHRLEGPERLACPRPR
jgi:hypothetical protein